MSLKSIKSWWHDQWTESFVRYPEVEKKRKIVVLLLGFDLIESKGGNSKVLWSDVIRINAFKRDLFTVDLVCFEFHQTDSKPVVEVNEHNTGFSLLEDSLVNQFEGFDANWREKVLKPAFATNLTEVWKKKCDGHRPPLH